MPQPSSPKQITTKPGNSFFDDQLDRTGDRPFLLNDTVDKREWLVSELSVAIHIALAWASKQLGRSDALNRTLQGAVSGTAVRLHITQL